MKYTQIKKILLAIPTTLTVSGMMLFAQITPIHAAEGSNDIHGDVSQQPSRAKISHAIARYRARGENLSSDEGLDAYYPGGGGCGNIAIGNVKSRGNEKVENIIVIKGDVINANNRCRNQ